MAAAHIFQPSARGCDPSAFLLPTLTPSGPAEDLAEVTAMLEHVAGALQEVLVAFGGEMTEVDRCGRAIAAHRALALVSRVRSEESPAVGRSVWARGTRAECMEQGAELERAQGLTSWTVAPLNEAAGRWALFI
jgi:hypothetical protein